MWTADIMHETRRKIFSLIAEKSQLSVDQIARELNISPMTVRHHLGVLQQDGLVEGHSQKGRRCVGRPRYVYSLTPAGAEQFPSNLTLLTHALFTYLEGSSSPQEMNRLVVYLAQELAGPFSAPVDAAPAEKLDQIALFLNNLGYQASWEPLHNGGQSYRIHLKNCPYRWLAGRHALLCEMDDQLLKLLGAKVHASDLAREQRQETRGCVFHIQFRGFGQQTAL